MDFQFLKPGIVAGILQPDRIRLGLIPLALVNIMGKEKKKKERKY